MDWESLGVNRVKRPLTRPNEPSHTNIPTAEQNAVTGTAGGKTDVSSLEDAKAFHLTMGKRMQEQLRNGGNSLQTLNRAIRDRRPPEEIALVAVKLVSLLMLEPRIFDGIKTEYKERYKICLDDKVPYEIIHLPSETI